MASLFKDPHFVLLVVDPQIDFEPGGALAVSGGHEIAKPIAELMQKCSQVIVTQDSHPPGHISFASSYSNKKPFDTLTLVEVQKGNIQSHFSREVLQDYLHKIPQQTQVLWPDHCVVGTSGWAFDPQIPLERAMLLLRKGMRLECDSYSAFFENDGTPTGLSGYLKERNIQTMGMVGLAGDYCVYWSAQDARREGFNVLLDESLTRFVNFPEGSRERSLVNLKNLDVKFTHFLQEN